jgi:hypothetical protein
MEPTRIDGFFKHLTEHYNKDTTCLFKSWISYKKKFYTSNHQLKFLLRCRRYDLLPPHIKNLRIDVSFHSNYAKRKFKNIIKDNQRRLLKALAG